MNERIKEFRFLAAEYTNEKKPLGLTKWNEVRDMKFAELIVRECTHIIANQAWESRTAGANGDWTEYNTLSRVAGQIKEHFGVEE